MRWLIEMAALVSTVFALYVGFIVSANSGVDVVLLNFFSSTPQQTVCQQTRQLVIAFRQFNLARTLVRKTDFAAANVVLDRAIGTLGYLYEPSWPIYDDTGLYLGVARDLERRGNLRAAVMEKCRMLHTRLDLCGEVLVRGPLRQRILHVGAMPEECPS